MAQELIIQVYNNIASGAPPIQVIETEISSSSIFVQPQEDVAPINIQVYENTTSGTFPIQVIQSEFSGAPIFVEVQEDYAPVQSVNGKIGWVTINKSDVGLSNVENVSIINTSGYLQNEIDNIYDGNLSGIYYLNSNPSGFITGVDLSTYAQIQQLNDLQPDEGGIIVSYAGGLWDYVPDNLGFNITDGDLIIYRNGSPIAGITPEYLTSNRSYILPNSNGTIALLINANPIFAPNLVYNTGQQSISGTKNFTTRPQVNNIGVLISGEAYPSNNPSGFITGVDLSSLYPRSNPSGFITGVDLSALYPRSNPSGFITGVNLSSYITTGQTGAFYPASNPSGFITGVNLSSYITTGQTGAFYPASNPSGFITGVDTSNFYTKDNPSGFITGVEKQTKLFDYVTGIPIYMYVGSAPFGSSQNDNIWDIYRTEIDQNGLVVSNLLAINTTWTGRYLENYM
jgi:hypothetical protein